MRSDVDEAKLLAATWFIIHRTSSGKLKLFKLLYLADFAMYWEQGRSITGEAYERWEHGPVPRTLWREYDSIIGRCATIENVVWPGVPFPEQRMHARGAPDLSALSPDELRILESTVAEYGARTGRQLRELTHALPYHATALGGVIPYHLAPYRTAPLDQQPTAEDIARVQRDESLRRTADAVLARRARAN